MLVIKMVEEHVCLHEKQLQEHSVTIGKLDAEMEYKKEKLDDLKEDNRRMEKKLDDLSKDISDFISQYKPFRTDYYI